MGISMEATARSMVDDARHYVHAVSRMAARHGVTAADDIYSRSGIKLVARGTPVDSSLREKLCGHRLAGQTLEESLAVEGGVTPHSLAADITALVDRHGWYRRLAVKSGDPVALRHGTSRLDLPREILFRLTVARDQRPGLYRHILGVTVISHYLALGLELKPETVADVLVAALCHDLGELHTDPAILAHGHRISKDERRFIYVHPITGSLMMRDLPGINSRVAKAIIQHQERFDGSGYPYGRKSDAIELGARILAAADVSEAITARFSDHERLSTLLRLNREKFDARVVDLLHESIDKEPTLVARFDREPLARRLTGFASVLDGWARLRASTTIAQDAATAFLSERMFNLRKVVLQFGFDPDSFDIPLQLAEADAAIAAELTAIVDELQFQLADLAHEFDRTSSQWLDALDPLDSIAINDWRGQLQHCIDGF